MSPQLNRSDQTAALLVLLAAALIIESPKAVPASAAEDHEADTTLGTATLGDRSEARRYMDGCPNESWHPDSQWGCPSQAVTGEESHDC